MEFGKKTFNSYPPVALNAKMSNVISASNLKQRLDKSFEHSLSLLSSEKLKNGPKLLDIVPVWQISGDSLNKMAV